MEIPFIGGAYEGRSKNINAQKSINLFPVYEKNEPKTPIAMYGTPGLVQFSAPATTAIVRGIHVLGSYVYAVVGAVVYEIASNGTAVSLGSITTSTGHVNMADNGTQILLVDGTIYGHIITLNTLTNIPEGTDFVSADDCIFFDGYFLATKTDTGRFVISDLYDGLVWAALDFATAESAADNLVGIGNTKQNVWLFGALTTEVYFNSGNADFPFERVPGAIIDTGCNALGSITEITGKIYWLSHKNQVVRSKGYGKEVVSTPSLDYQFSTYTDTTDVNSYTYTLEGRSFYVLTFPTADKTWVLDVENGQWHEWSSLDGTTPEIHRATCGTLNCTLFNNKVLVGDRANGKIYELDLDTYTDNTVAIKRTRRAQVINKERVNVIHNRIELEFEAGVGLNVAADADGYDPQVYLGYSDDGANTFSTGEAMSMGKYQEYTERQIWRRLGKSRNRVYEMVITEPVKVVLINATSELEACKV
jgi:hypothetical protein